MAKKNTDQRVKACTAKTKKGGGRGLRKMCSGTKRVCRWGKGASKRINGRKAGGLFKPC